MTGRNLYSIFFLLFLSASSFGQQNFSSWKGEVDLGNGFSLTTFLDISEEVNRIVITSPENWDKRVFGSLKAKIGRVLGKIPRTGNFIFIEGKLVGDSIKGDAKVAMFGPLKFKGILRDSVLNGAFISNDRDVIAILNSKRINEKRVDYNEVYHRILKVTQNNIYSKEVLQTKGWKRFQEGLKQLCNKAQDDIELFFGFKTLKHRIPFSHYNLFLNEEGNNKIIAEKIQTEIPTVVFEKRSDSIGYLKIKNFTSSQKELEVIFPEILKHNFPNLIIDLRDNGGGGIEAAFEFAKYIIPDTTLIGYFVTNKLKHPNFERSLFETLPKLYPQITTELIEDLKKGEGLQLMFPVDHEEVFTGNLFILTNNNTASTCEPIVYFLKENQKATIVGEKTAGAMLSATSFDVYRKYKLFLPIADFYTYDGFRIEGHGVKPDIKTNSEDAYEKVLEIIQKNSKR